MLQIIVALHTYLNVYLLLLMIDLRGGLGEKKKVYNLHKPTQQIHRIGYNTFSFPTTNLMIFLQMNEIFSGKGCTPLCFGY